MLSLFMTPAHYRHKLMLIEFPRREKLKLFVISASFVVAAPFLNNPPYAVNSLRSRFLIMSEIEQITVPRELVGIPR